MRRILLSLFALLLTCGVAAAQQPVRVCSMSGQATQCAAVNSSSQLSVTATTSPSGVTTTMATAAPTATMFSSILAASTTRKGCLVQNTGSTTGYVYFGATGSATTGNSFLLQPNSTVNCTTYAGSVLTDNVAATCASGTCAFVISSQ